jgi:hypothetical protein
VTLMRAGATLFMVGLAIIVVGSRTELQAINEAISRRLKAGIALVLGGVALILVGARVQGQIVFRRLKRRYQPQIDEAKGKLAPFRTAVQTIAKGADRG